MNKKALFSMIGLTVVSAGSMVSDTVNAAAYSESRSNLEEVFMAEAKSHKILAEVFRKLASAAAVDAVGNKRVLARVEKFQISAIIEEELFAKAMATIEDLRTSVCKGCSEGMFEVMLGRAVLAQESSERAEKAAKKADQLAQTARSVGLDPAIISEIDSSVIEIEGAARQAQLLSIDAGGRAAIAAEASEEQAEISI